MKTTLIAALIALLSACGGGAACDAGEPGFDSQKPKYHQDCDPPAPPASAASSGAGS